ncbi:hypothetical protein Tco_0504842 [Tanacetum coccineum]
MTWRTSKYFRFRSGRLASVRYQKILKALDEGYSSKNYVRKFLRALNPKWKQRLERKSSTPWRLENSRSSSSEEEGSCGDPNHLIGECPKPPKDKNQRDFVGGSWSDSGEEDDEKAKDETCLMAQASSEICLGVNLETRRVD